jgi:hypothetical protein
LNCVECLLEILGLGGEKRPAAGGFSIPFERSVVTATPEKRSSRTIRDCENDDVGPLCRLDRILDLELAGSVSAVADKNNSFPPRFALHHLIRRH